MKDSQCPNCGYCPNCGRSNGWAKPYTPYTPYVPYWQPIWYSNPEGTWITVTQSSTKKEA